LELIDARRLTEFSAFEPGKKDLYKRNMFNVVLAWLDAGQEIPSHPEPYDVVFYVVEGRRVFTVGDVHCEMSAGEMTFASKGTPRGIRGIERLRILGVQEAH